MKYLVRRGLNYTPPGGAAEKRAEIGDVVDDLPAHGTGRCGAGCGLPGSHAWLLEGGIIEAEPQKRRTKQEGA